MSARAPGPFVGLAYDKDGIGYQIVRQVYARFGRRGTHLCLTVRNLRTLREEDLSAEESREVLAIARTAKSRAEAGVRVDAEPDMLAALERARRLFDEALPKFNWATSALDANAIALLNDVPAEVRAAIAKARGGT